jgi:predicted AAA+ superfamily ATPase
MNRSISSFIREDLSEKIILLSGPRQVGKTTLAKSLLSSHEYLNFDIPEDRLQIMERTWNRQTELVILDELHKMKDWKTYLKGFYDKEKQKPPILVTGSARLDIAKKVGDSLAGRHFSYRLFPLDPKELTLVMSPKDALDTTLNFSGFPEPFYKANKSFYGKWKKSHLESIIRQDLLDLENVRDLVGIETLMEMLRDRVGSPISYLSLARDLQKDSNTIKRWIEVLERLFLIFRITPFHKNVGRSLLKEGKVYFFDVSLPHSLSAKIENAVALSLLKELSFREDTEGKSLTLHFLRTKDGKEIDFLIAQEHIPKLMIEVKEADETPSSNFNLFLKAIPGLRAEQWVYQSKKIKEYPSGIRILPLATAIEKMDIF